ncbi:MAG: creatininase family protein [Zestosphaera sp.]
MPKWLHEMTWPEVKHYLEGDDRILVPVGSTEQHGRFAPLGTDTLVAIALAEDASDATGVPIVPPLWFGWSPHHMIAPGTISVRPEVLSEVLHDVVASLSDHGFRKFVVINGHRLVNIPWMQVVAERARRVLKVHVVLFDPAYMSREVASELGFGPVGHADEIETSHMLYRYPGLVKRELIRDCRPAERPLYHPDPRDVRDTLCYVPSTREDMERIGSISGDYISGSPSKASPEKGRRYHGHLVSRLVEVLEHLKSV